MEPNSPRKIQFTVPLLEPHLDPEAAEQIRRRRPTPANLVLSSDQSSPEIDEDRLPNPLLKSGLAMSPRQRKKVARSTPTMKGSWNVPEGGSRILRDPRAGMIRDPRAGMIRDSRAGMIQDSRAGMIRDSRAGMIQDSRAGMIQDSRAGMIRDPRRE
uniref:protein phosphatase 1 regulatory subunit 1A n=1 Tax=Lonchura striata TaxID=40157 RepID=UPI000B4C809D|nr:protein phosphatase 1 regulatory subunit 1A [Lonchura striata domestica]